MRGSSNRKGGEVTLVERKVLKRSADEGKLSIRDVVRKNHCSLPDLLLNNADADTLALLEQSPELGSGTYGQAKEVGVVYGDGSAAAEGGGIVAVDNKNTSVVAKITGCASGLLGDVAHSPWRAEHVEPKLLQFLWAHLVETNVTPHLVAPLGGTHTIIEGTTVTQKGADKEIANSLVYFMEKATKGSVRAHLKRLMGGAHFDRVVKVIMFQVCYTLASIYMRFPSFRHNDLKDDNVLLHVGPTEGCTEYTIHGTTFHVPNVGVTVLVADLDFACISGYMFDNYKVVEQEWETPSYHIDARQDHASDMACFIAYLRNQFSSKMTPALKDVLKNIYGTSRRDNGYRATYLDAVDFPTAMDLLLDTRLFEEWVTPAGSAGGGNPITLSAERRYDSPGGAGRIVDSFNADRNLHTIPPAWPAIPITPQEVRHCFMFRPRHVNAIDVSYLPSYTYLERCRPVFAYIDNDPPKEHDQPVCERLLEMLECVYDIQADPKRDKAGFGFARDKFDAFYDKVDEIASAFIIDYFVPERWWPAAYTCAFIDAVEEMDLAASNQVCWHFYQWCRFWEQQGEVRYTEMNLLHFAVQWGWLRK